MNHSGWPSFPETKRCTLYIAHVRHHWKWVHLDRNCLCYHIHDPSLLGSVSFGKAFEQHHRLGGVLGTRNAIKKENTVPPLLGNILVYSQIINLLMYVATVWWYFFQILTEVYRNICCQSEWPRDLWFLKLCFPQQSQVLLVNLPSMDVTNRLHAWKPDNQVS